LIYVQAFWCTTKEVRQQHIIITVNLIVQKPLICSWKPSFSFSQDSYWAASYFFHGFSWEILNLISRWKTISFANINTRNLLRFSSCLCLILKKYTRMLCLKYRCQNAKLSLFWENSCSIGNLYSRKYIYFLYFQRASCSKIVS